MMVMIVMMTRMMMKMMMMTITSPTKRLKNGFPLDNTENI